jgi:hypothetical protein
MPARPIVTAKQPEKQRATSKMQRMYHAISAITSEGTLINRSSIAVGQSQQIHYQDDQHRQRRKGGPCKQRHAPGVTSEWSSPGGRVNPRAFV